MLRFLLVAQVIAVVSLGFHSPLYAKAYPWFMFLPAIVNGTPPISDTCADDDLIFDRYLPMGKNCDVIKDIVTNLEWQRCSVGQTWNPDTKRCDGAPAGYSWYSADAQSFPDGWRMPNVTELRSLVYCSTGDPILIGNDLYDATCNGEYTRPTIIVEAFPDVPWVGNSLSAHYWTSSSNDNDSGMAWVVNFYKGNVGDDGNKITPGLSIRLVRPPTN
ncbi:MAG TPA: hypothetical protein DDY20_09090 [Desulfobulbaceae bacterium]|nr:hypothetical protein [Desulfobulbaceae bacterium]